ncbi:MAG: YqeG family HAD IIIA-type phosphatase [Armatimonadetes bacterium]|nr:YqeG family HAD IIIA-type phosphatase [Armatimonadota bacterium]
MFSLSRLLTPSLIVRAVTDCSAVFLQERGITAVVSDLDNTLLPYHGADDAVSPEVLGWLADLHGVGIGVCLASNTTRLGRLARLAASWGISHVPRTAGKPGTAGIRHALDLLGAEPQNAAMVGDQLFTDMVGGNQLGMFTVLVNPLSTHEFVGTRLVSRPLERLVLRGARARPQ